METNLEMPLWFQEEFRMAFIRKDLWMIKELNKTWRRFLKDEYGVILKG